MNIQKHFEPKRFLNYLKYDLLLNGRTYLFFGIGLVIAIFCISLFSIATSNHIFNYKNYIPICILIFSFSAIIVIGNSFPALRNNKKRSNFLMLPASVFEKFLVEFVLKTLLFLIFFLPLFWIVVQFSYTFYALFNWKNPVGIETIGILDIFRYIIQPLDQMAILFSIFSFATFLFAGASYFNKYALIKTILAFAALIVLFFTCMISFSHLFFDNPRNEFLYIELPNYKIRDGLSNIQVFLYILGMASSLFLVPIAYFKLKEKEV